MKGIERLTWCVEEGEFWEVFLEEVVFGVWLRGSGREGGLNRGNSTIVEGG